MSTLLLDPNRFRYTKQTTFGRRHMSSSFTQTSSLLWIVSSFSFFSIDCCQKSFYHFVFLKNLHMYSSDVRLSFACGGRNASSVNFSTRWPRQTTTLCAMVSSRSVSDHPCSLLLAQSISYNYAHVHSIMFRISQYFL